MRRILTPGLLAIWLVLVAVAAPVGAADRHEISIDAITTFDAEPDEFTATGIPGCPGGEVADGPAIVQFTPGPGVYAGFKEFSCKDSSGGFILRLNARFGPTGSTGTWTVVESWGDAAGMAGAGKLWGEPIEDGILDHYQGYLTF